MCVCMSSSVCDYNAYEWVSIPSVFMSVSVLA